MSNVGVVVAQKISSALSVLGSSYIFQEVIRDRTKRSKVVFRLLASMSFSDAFCSIWFFVGSWAVPAGWPGIPGAQGTVLTCRIQAFILYFAVTTFNFNGCLALYYLLSIRYSWSEEKIKKYVEPFCYVYSITIGLAVGATPTILNLFNPANFWCSIKPDESKGTKYIWFLFYVPCWFAAVFITFSMTAIYMHVRKTETRALRHDFQHRVSRSKSLRERLSGAFRRTGGSEDGSVDIDEALDEAHQELPDQNVDRLTASYRASLPPSNTLMRRKRSRKVANQALLYCFAFYLTLVIPTTTRTIQTLGGKAPEWMLVLFMALYPLQGFLNFLVYMRPRWVQKWKQEKRARQRRSLRNATHSNPNRPTTNSRNSHSGSLRFEPNSTKATIRSGTSQPYASQEEMPDDPEDHDVEKGGTNKGARETSVVFVLPEEKEEEEILERKLSGSLRIDHSGAISSSSSTGSSQSQEEIINLHSDTEKGE